MDSKKEFSPMLTHTIEEKDAGEFNKQWIATMIGEAAKNWVVVGRNSFFDPQTETFKGFIYYYK